MLNFGRVPIPAQNREPFISVLNFHQIFLLEHNLGVLIGHQPKQCIIKGNTLKIIIHVAVASSSIAMRCQQRHVVFSVFKKFTESAWGVFCILHPWSFLCYLVSTKIRKIIMIQFFKNTKKNTCKGKKNSRWIWTRCCLQFPCIINFYLRTLRISLWGSQPESWWKLEIPAPCLSGPRFWVSPLGGKFHHGKKRGKFQGFVDLARKIQAAKPWWKHQYLDPADCTICGTNLQPWISILCPTNNIRSNRRFWKKGGGYVQPTLPENEHIPPQGTFEDDYPFPKVGYGSSQGGTSWINCISNFKRNVPCN